MFLQYDLRQGQFQIAKTMFGEINILAEPIWHVLTPDDFEHPSLQVPTPDYLQSSLPDLRESHSSFQFPRDEDKMDYEFINQDAQDFVPHQPGVSV